MKVTFKHTTELVPQQVPNGATIDFSEKEVLELRRYFRELWPGHTLYPLKQALKGGAPDA